ncbi:squamous cell carcinoma antigen recognized by T-cells 3-like [Paramacrobiotus metropolitanus]|uniref:squamous cell carcinoma antigen recognized by T-cells 3-like n=1 Tax=Paramacrobiotus metropolitanus TaxID=2943436 RepID=UPI002445AC0F|nr:squamous cell carcinoma antigen recognized by T-cells 3-like [Paramacrobiotus metropolitanus]XP_055327990.1 squamous cell carcinoma antigen recognized by T-cells 3-like [Paramacrobiotus metropolitanus]XP_055327991.1 squamous cell carcinoma antigen recognized by T-cells 3-like [Paramacrobiotus metropolitanus]
MAETKNSEKSFFEASDEKFRVWTEEVERISMSAVFKKQRDTMQQIYDHLELKEKVLKGLMDDLASHLGRQNTNGVSHASTSSISPPTVTKQAHPAAPGRMAANFPLMSDVSVPVSLPAAPVMPPAVQPLPFPGFARTNGITPVAWPSKAALPNNWRDTKADPGPIGPPSQAVKGAQSWQLGEDWSSVDSDGSGETVPKKIFVANLARDSDARTIASYFKQFGPVADVKIFRFQNGESRGFGAVEFTDATSAEKAIDMSKHIIDRREVVALPFKDPGKNKSEKPVKRYQVFLGGVPTFLSKPEVEAAVKKYYKVRELKLNSERGYAYLDLVNEDDVDRILKAGYIKIGEKMVECKPNKRN